MAAKFSCLPVVAELSRHRSQPFEKQALGAGKRVPAIKLPQISLHTLAFQVFPCWRGSLAAYASTSNGFSQYGRRPLNHNHAEHAR